MNSVQWFDLLLRRVLNTYEAQWLLRTIQTTYIDSFERFGNCFNLLYAVAQVEAIIAILVAKPNERTQPIGGGIVVNIDFSSASGISRQWLHYNIIVNFTPYLPVILGQKRMYVASEEHNPI